MRKFKDNGNFPGIHEFLDDLIKQTEVMKLDLADIKNREMFYKTVIIKKFTRKKVKTKTGERIVSVCLKERPTKMCNDPVLKKFHICLNDYMTSLVNDNNIFYNFHSYIKNRSIRTAGLEMTGMKSIVALDIKDFYPSIKEPAIRYVLQTYYGIQKNMIKKILPYITISSTDNRFPEYGELPQGTEYSGLIAGSVLYRLDNIINEYCIKKDYRYIRYSDNLFIGSKSEMIPIEVTNELIDMIENFNIEGHNFFKVKKEKIKFMPYYKQQRVCGVIVNEKVNVPRSKESKTRSALHHLYNEYSDFIKNCYDYKITPQKAFTQFNKMEKRKRKVFGNLSYMCGLNPEKYIKYSPQQRSIEIISSEAKNMFNWRDCTVSGSYKNLHTMRQKHLSAVVKNKSEI